MSPEPFEFIPGPADHSLIVAFRGFWTSEDVEAYQKALNRRAAEADNKSQVTKVILDLRTCVLQSQKVMVAIRRIIEGYGSQIKCYGLLLPNSALLKLQMIRVLEGASVQIFEDEADARIWLRS